jgi:thioredoxin 1
MTGNWWRALVVAALVAAVVVVVASKDRGPAAPASESQGLPKMLELGANKCTACKMMKSVMAELEKEYAGKLQVEFIDVWQHQDAVARYRVETIPTQILFDANGKEFFRHQGFLSKRDIVKAFNTHGVDLEGGNRP